MINIYHCGEINASFVFTSKRDIWRRLVQAQPEAFKFMFQDLLVLQWLENVEYHEYQTAGAGDYKHTEQH